MQRQTVPSTMQSPITTGLTRVTVWRARSIAFLRIAYGLIWAIAAALKWQPAFISSFSDQVTGAAKDQPQGVQSWINFWGNIVNSNPHFYAYLTATVETALALFLVFGLLTHLTCFVGFVWSLGIWAIPEGFGGPYQAGSSTDVGTALLYALMFAVLFAISAGRYYGVDQWLTPRLGRLGFLASGRFRYDPERGSL
jgi:thiosulfate dehydrogenase [quinone] large subunit